MWLAIGAGTVVLLVAAVRKKDAQHCKKVDINIRGVQNNFFIDEKDILDAVTNIAKGNPVGKTIGSFNLKKMETELEKNIWVKDAELFFDNNEVLAINVLEREPIARIFTTGGSTFYIDHSILRLPLSEKFSARLPVFTNFPSESIILSKEDSSLLNDIKNISLAIQKDSFRMAIIDQVDITPQRTFEMIPKIGNQTILFGDAAEAEEKFNKLQLFYEQVMAKSGLNYYSTINVQYKGQVVAKRRGAEDVTADSLKTLQIMQLIAINAEKAASDSLQTMIQDNNSNTADSSMIQQSIQRDDNNEPSNTIEKPQPQEEKKHEPVLISEKPVINRTVKRVNLIPPQKPTPNLLKTDVTKPKATMPNKNDY